MVDHLDFSNIVFSWNTLKNLAQVNLPAWFVRFGIKKNLAPALSR